MSDATLPKTQPVITPHHIVIVASRYNERYTNALVDHCVDELNNILPNGKTEIIRVPGAFEIPVAVQAIAKAKGSRPVPSAIIALGVIIQGSTDHADLVGTSVTTALMNTALETSIPVIHEVLLLESEQQAEDRCISLGKNRGREAAGTAVSMAELFISRFTTVKS